MWKQLKTTINDWVCHRVIYGGLAGTHGFAAWATEKPEVYVPMMVLYGALSWRG